MSHRLYSLAPRPQRRYFPTDQGIMAAAQGKQDPDSFLSRYPVSRQWFRILAEILDAVAVVYHVAALIAATDTSGQPVRVDHYRQGPYDALVTLSQGRTLGIIRLGPTLPSPNLRYRPRAAENLPYRQQPGHCQNRPGAVAVSRYRPSEAPRLDLVVERSKTLSEPTV